VTKLRVALTTLAIVGVAGAAFALARPRGGDPASSPPTTITAPPTTTTTSTTTSATAAPSTTGAPVSRWAPVPFGPAKAVVTPNGLVLAVLASNADGTFVARSPCGGEATVRGEPVSGANVVLDPGHGGDEPGAVGPGGTKEKAVNLAVAQATKQQLEALGATVVLTRTADYRITLLSRAAIATNLRPQLFVSIHHNAAPDGRRDGPGAETYSQIASPESKRASGLLYEELVRAFEPYEVAWVADRDAGAKYRLRADGGDYYGILNRTDGIPAVLSEAAFITNPPEEELLADPAFQAVEARAITEAVVRFLTTDDPGSGFVEPYPRTEPAGPGGGAAGCVDPPLG
jgi:N-acetylmuramoyl-L-alanine amidase